MIGTDVYNRFEKKKGGSSGVKTDLFVYWLDEANRMLYVLLKDRDASRFIDEGTTYTISSSPETEALPATFRDIAPEGCGFYVQNSDGTYQDRPLVETGFGSKDKGYYFQGSNVVFTGFSTATTIKLRFIPVLTEITDLSDTLVFRDEDIAHVTEAMNVAYGIWRENPDEEVVADQRFVRAIKLMLSGYRRSKSAFRIKNNSHAG